MAILSHHNIDAKFNVLNCSPSSFKDFLEDREALADPVLGLLVRTGCCSFWFGVRGRNLRNENELWTGLIP